MRLSALGWVAVLVGGCASIRISESVTETPLRPSVRNEVVEGSVEYAVTATVRKDQISLSIDQSETCAAITTPRSHRMTSVTRVGDPTVVRMTWLLATVGLGLGAYGYANANSLAVQANARSMGSASTSEEYRAYAMGATLVGIGAVTLGAIDALRATDYQRDDGVIKRESHREESSCRHRKTRRKDVVLMLPERHKVSARLNEEGGADFTLMAIPEEGIPSDEAELSLVIGDARLTIDLSSEQRGQLQSALLANPRSRLAMDALAKRQAGCAQGVATAQKVTRDEVDANLDAVRTAWGAAKATCADLWTSELADVERRVGESRCNQRLARAATALQGEVLADAVDAITADLAAVRAVCTSMSHVAQVRQLELSLAAVTKRIAREEAELARREAREEAQALKAAQRPQRKRTSTPRSWGSARLRCNDGTLSPTCTCGRSSYRGCCSWHGGVDTCSVSSP